ncbi:MAG: MtrB/PioB family decaheme-associated outer membrane protein, partial [Burkholderiaceae bacterium]
MKSNQQRPALRLGPLALALGLAFGPAGASAQMLFSVPWYGNADMSPYSENHVEFGMGYFGSGIGGLGGGLGQWTGLGDSGYKLFGSVVAGDRDDASGRYWDLSGFNLGLSSAMVNGEVGRQGVWWLRGDYQGITKLDARDALVRYTSGAVQTPLPSYVATDIESRRNTYNLAGGLGFLGNWKTFADYTLTQRSGNSLTGSRQAQHTSLAPMDDETQRMKLGASYSLDAFQGEVAYTFSRYTNNVGNQFQVGTGSTPFISLAPDNDWNQISAKGGYSFSRATRLTAALAHSWTSQNTAFADTGKVFLGGPGGDRVSSLDGKVKQTVAEFTLNSRVTRDLNLRAHYRFQDRDNQTPSYFYDEDASPGSGTHKGHTLRPSDTKNRLSLEGDYSLARRTKLAAWYQYEQTKYKHNFAGVGLVGAGDAVTGKDGTIRDDLKNNQLGLELRSRANEFVTGSLRYQYDQRSGAEYQSRAMTNINNGSADNATLRQFWLADYAQNLVRAQLNLMPIDTVAVQLRADWRDRNYDGMTCGGVYDIGVGAGDKTCLGLTGSQRQTYTLDTQWTASDVLQLFGFYTYGQQKQTQLGNANANLGLASAWWTNSTADDHTIGLGGNYTFNPRWKFGAQYNWVNGVEKYNQGQGGAAPALQLPDNKYIENQLQLTANWQFKPDTALRLNYIYSHLKGANWGYDGWGSGYPVGSLPYTNGLRSADGADQLVYLS